jgi:hypothetical protein
LRRRSRSCSNSTLMSAADHVALRNGATGSGRNKHHGPCSHRFVTRDTRSSARPLPWARSSSGYSWSARDVTCRRPGRLSPWKRMPRSLSTPADDTGIRRARPSIYLHRAACGHLRALQSSDCIRHSRPLRLSSLRLRQSADDRLSL